MVPTSAGPARGRRGHRDSVPAMTMDAAAAARSLLEDAIARRVTPGAVLHAVARDGRELRLAVGCLTYDEGSAPVTEDTVYDLASLTKVVSCLPLLLHLLAAGLLRVLPGLDLTVRRTFRFALPAGGLGGTAAHFVDFARRVGAAGTHVSLCAGGQKG